jgi:hypothetical protein
MLLGLGGGAFDSASRLCVDALKIMDLREN